MDENKEAQVSPECGSNCTCHQKKGLPPGVKLILLLGIVIFAGTVLAFSIAKKSRTAARPSSTSFAATIAQNSALCTPAQAARPSDAVAAVPETKATLTKLASLSSLDTVARDVAGVFVLLAGTDAQVVASATKEIEAARNTVASRGIQMRSFQLNTESADYTKISTQLPPPCIVVAFKGKGIRGIPCTNLTQDKLLQICLAAMQPGGCCAAGSGRSCGTQR